MKVINMPVCRQCGKEFPNRVKVNGEIKILNSRKFCLDCSPFGLHNTSKHILGTKCIYCGETDPNKFYGHKTSVCAACHNKDVTERGRDNRAFAIEHLGGKCVACGYDKYPCSLDIHHKDPSIKDEHFRNLRGWSKKRILREIEKCILLCRNCHTAYHSGYDIEM
jgi:Zn ribbon nucleic-acid-binding protein